MAQLMESVQVGKREDLADYIDNLDMKDTPVSSRLSRGKKLVNSEFSWQCDAFPDSKSEGVVDGVDAALWENMDARARLYGRCQKHWRLPAVSDFADNLSNVAGLGQGREMAEQVRKALVMLKRDREHHICKGTGESQQDAGPGTPSLTRSLGTWIQATAQTDLPVPTAFLTPAGSIKTTAIASFTETILGDIMQSISTQSGVAVDIDGYVGPTLKRQISTFTTWMPSGVTDMRRVAAAAGTAVQMVDVVKNDFGTCRIHLTYFNAKDTAYAALRGYFLNMGKLELRFNRMPRVVPQENKGGGPRSIVDEIYALVCSNPLAHGKLAGTS